MASVASGSHQNGDRAAGHLRLVFTRRGRITSMRIRPWVAGPVALATIVFGTLYVAAAVYLLLGDDLLVASVEKQSRIQDEYEDRIDILRSQIDRITSRHLIAQKSFDGHMQRLVERQEALDVRQDIIANLSQTARRAKLVPEQALLEPTEGDAPRSTGAAGAATNATLRGTAQTQVDREARVRQFEDISIAAGQLAERQIDYIDTIARSVSGKADRLSSILEGIEVNHGASAVGGPFVLPAQNTDPTTFRSNVALVTEEIERLDRIGRFARSLPLEPPLAKAKITSNYGPRLDPFLRRRAVHSGIDYRARSGRPVTATAPGVVISAKYSGGYGKLVAIDHGNGIVTRFGHLSRMSVKTGQSVERGDVVGKVGSTGRSTGPHLHYEIRHDGHTVDPRLFFNAGRGIAEILQVGDGPYRNGG